jgi:hypothetical protein
MREGSGTGRVEGGVYDNQQQACTNDSTKIRTSNQVNRATGGHLGGKGDGRPGPQTTWIGLQRLQDFAIAWTIFGPDAQANPPTCL